jgi:hypothetical protein
LDTPKRERKTALEESFHRPGYNWLDKNKNTATVIIKQQLQCKSCFGHRIWSGGQKKRYLGGFPVLPSSLLNKIFILLSKLYLGKGVKYPLTPDPL